VIPVTGTFETIPKLGVPSSTVAETPVTEIFEAMVKLGVPTANVAETPDTLSFISAPATIEPTWKVADTPVTGTATSIRTIDDEKGIWEKGAVEKVMVGSYAPLKLLRVHFRVNEKFLSVAATPVSLNLRALPTETMLLPVAVVIAFVVPTAKAFRPVTVVSVPAALVAIITEATIAPADSFLEKVFTVKVKGESTKRNIGVKPESSSSPY
jgi:hypothetical protein